MFCARRQCASLPGAPESIIRQLKAEVAKESATPIELESITRYVRRVAVSPSGETGEIDKETKMDVGQEGDS